MARHRKTDKAMDELRGAARAATSSAPPGYEEYAIDWGRLTEAETAAVCEFADALREIRRNELDLLRLGTVDYIRAMHAELRKLEGLPPA